MTTSMVELRPAVSEIRFDSGNEPFLIGSRCQTCETVFVGERAVCANCGSRDSISSHELADTGRVHTYSIVHRSFPGVETPFISAVIALDGGGNVQATVKDVTIDADEQLFGVPVKIVFSPVDQTDSSGRNFLAYHFVPSINPEGAN